MSVYFAQAGRYLKIGYSANPLSRVETITISGTRPPDLARGTSTRLIGWVPGNERREIEFHVQFAKQRVEGEWFVGIDLEEVRALLWADPSGIDFENVSGLAAMAALKYPHATRDQMETAGIRVRANRQQDVDWSFLGLSPAVTGGA